MILWASRYRWGSHRAHEKSRHRSEANSCNSLFPGIKDFLFPDAIAPANAGAYAGTRPPAISRFNLEASWRTMLEESFFPQDAV